MDKLSTKANLTVNTVLTFDSKPTIYVIYFYAPKLFTENVFSSAVDPDSDSHGSILILVRGIRIQEGKNYPQKYKNVKKSHVFEVLEVLFEE